MLSKNIISIRTELGLSQYDIAEKLGLSQSSVALWETGKNIPSSKNLIRLANLLHVSVEELTGESSSTQNKSMPRNARRAYSSRRATAPFRVLGKVHAGHLDEEETVDKEIEIPSYVAENHPQAFVLEVTGDCMNRVIPNGAHILVDPTKQAVNGSIVVVEDENYNAIMRRCYRGANTLMLTADSYLEFDDIIYSEDSEPIKLIGVVVWYQSADELQ